MRQCPECYRFWDWQTVCPECGTPLLRNSVDDPYSSEDADDGNFARGEAVDPVKTDERVVADVGDVIKLRWGSERYSVERISEAISCPGRVMYWLKAFNFVRGDKLFALSSDIAENLTKGALFTLGFDYSAYPALSQTAYK